MSGGRTDVLAPARETEAAPKEAEPKEASLKDLRIVYVGARIVGHRCLDAILKAGANVVGLLTLDAAKEADTVAFTSFDDLIAGHGLNARHYTTLKDAAHTAWVRDLDADLGIVIGVSQLIPQEILDLPRYGFIGMHPTLLPEGRGRAPIPWAIIKGLERTGTSLFYCDAGADTGDLAAQKEVPVFKSDTASTLGSRTDDAAIDLLLDVLPRFAAGAPPRWQQDESKATTWPRRRPEDGRIDWTKTPAELDAWVRALTHPYPGAFAAQDGRPLFIWSATGVESALGEPPGTVIARNDGVHIACTGGSLRLGRVQWQGAAECDAADAGLVPGSRLE